MAPLKKKGDLAELKVATDLVARGCELSIPFGEDSSYDLIADYEGRLHRVQVKYTKSDGRVVIVRCRSHSLTKDKIRRTKIYTRGDGRLDSRLRRNHRALLLRPFLDSRHQRPQ
ncbi:MAG TPA: group I intron-associated PD-(D/E)XK endonuclease [Solirubrobacterales bacterium]